MISKQDFIELVWDYSVNGCDSRVIMLMNDKKREIIALAAGDTENIEDDDMATDKTLDSYYQDFVKAEKEIYIAWAKTRTAEYAKTHKGRNTLERECIKNGYISIEPSKLDPKVKSNGKMIFALSKNVYGTGKNWIPVCDD